MTNETDFTRLMLDAQGDPHCLALLLESTRAELLDVARLLDVERHQGAALVAELAQVRADCAAELNLREDAIEHNANQAKRWLSRYKVLAKAAVPFFDDWLSLYVRFQRAALNTEAQEMHKTAEEMLALIGSTVE